MSDPEKHGDERPPEPRGFGEHVRGLAGEYAHEQGWGLNEEERTVQPQGHQDTFGGNEYNYGAQDFGDEPKDMSADDGSAADKLEQDVKKALGASNARAAEPAATDALEGKED